MTEARRAIAAYDAWLAAGRPDHGPTMDELTEAMNALEKAL